MAEHKFANIRYAVQVIIVDNDVPVRFIMRERPGQNEHVRFIESLKHGEPFAMWGVYLPNDDGTVDEEHETSVFINPSMIAAASVSVMPS